MVQVENKSPNGRYVYNCFNNCLISKWMKVAQLCLTLGKPINCGPPGFCVHGILQARILEWVPFTRASSQPRDWGLDLDHLHCRQILHHLSHEGSPIQHILTKTTEIVRFFKKAKSNYTLPTREALKFEDTDRLKVKGSKQCFML